jgi:hypothetical protein
MMRRRWLLGLVGLALLLAACSSGPKDVARNFYVAFERHEFSKAKGYVCSALTDELDTWIREQGEQRIDVTLDVQYKQTEKTKDYAVIQVSGTRRTGGETFPVNYRIRVDKAGGWKVCDMRAVP